MRPLEIGPGLQEKGLRPIVYEINEHVRFTDLDIFGHLSSSKYLELLLSSRFRFGGMCLGFSQKRLVEMGYGYPMVTHTINFKNSITEIGSVKVTSYISNIEGKKLVANFAITSLDKKVVYADGTFSFLVYDLKQAKVVDVPEVVMPAFFENYLTDEVIDGAIEEQQRIKNIECSGS